MLKNEATSPVMRKKPAKWKIELENRKFLAAEKVREEKKILREKKKMNHEKYLNNSAMRRKNSEMKLIERKILAQKAEELKDREKQKHVQYLQEKLEEDKLWKEELEQIKIAEKTKELSLKTIERFEEKSVKEKHIQSQEEANAMEFAIKRQEFKELQNYKKAERERDRKSLHDRLILERRFKESKRLKAIEAKLTEIENIKSSQLDSQDIADYKRYRKLQERISLANKRVIPNKSKKQVTSTPKLEETSTIIEDSLSSQSIVQDSDPIDISFELITPLKGLAPIEKVRYQTSTTKPIKTSNQPRKSSMQYRQSEVPTPLPHPPAPSVEKKRVRFADPIALYSDGKTSCYMPQKHGKVSTSSPKGGQKQNIFASDEEDDIYRLIRFKDERQCCNIS